MVVPESSRTTYVDQSLHVRYSTCACELVAKCTGAGFLDRGLRDAAACGKVGRTSPGFSMTVPFDEPLR